MPATLIADALPKFEPPRADDFIEAARDPERVRLGMRLAALFDELPRLPERLRQGWDRLRRSAVENGLDALHAGREEYAKVYANYIATADQAVSLAAAMRLPDLPKLEQSRTELVRLRDQIFSKWHTEDDLAEMLLELVQLSHAELKAIAAAHPPPQSWYEETFDPFASE